MEVILIRYRYQRLPVCFLHVCGGDPDDENEIHDLQGVFSTYVEVILIEQLIKIVRLSFLHVCGGDPISVDKITNLIWFSPRMWR